MGRKIKCGVCGHKILPLKKDIYICTEPAERINILYPGSRMINVIDCPQCGCQKYLAERLMRPAVRRC